MFNEKISIIFFYRCGAERLRESLDAIFEQNYANTEVVFIADDFDVPCAEMLRRYRDRMRFVVKQQGHSHGKILNDSLRLTNGGYFCIVNACSLLHRDALREKVALFNKHPEISAVCSDFSVLDRKELLCHSFFYAQADVEAIAEGEFFFMDKPQGFLVRSGLPLVPFTLFRKDAYLLHGPFSEDFAVYPELSFLIKACADSALGFVDRVLGNA
ncbi:MAG: glycosyltransferase, partial [Candidatus Omnitrophica bacterium]|nr:glycosyltransferase [Candidatus Omnitrophota bacterium]